MMLRLSSNEIQTLKSALKYLSDSAQLYLFGSRVDDSKRGGDIDLLVVSNELSMSDLRKLKFDFYDKFGEQKIDIVLDNGITKEPFIEIIKKKAILL